MKFTTADRSTFSLEHKPVVLTTVPYYLPGFKGGGKLVSVRNLVAGLGSQYRFRVLTADRDLGDAHPYQGIDLNRWIENEDSEVFYTNSHRDWLEPIGRALSRTDYDVLHLNTVFSLPFGIVPLLLRRFGRFARKPLIVAPRGELGPGALAIKSVRKRTFLAVARRVGLFEGVRWQATGDEEARDIRGIFGLRARISVAPDLLSPEYRSWKVTSYRKRFGRLDILFLSRVTPKKNLHLAIEALRGLPGDITFRIVGPIDDEPYWGRCRKLILTLPSNVRTEYSGPIAIAEVGNMLGRHGLFFLPTANENFGYVIFEALLTGCPVLTSDQTPWRGLAKKGIGWDLPLSRVDSMRATLKHCVAMDELAHREMSLRARQFALSYLVCDRSAIRNAEMFRDALRDCPPPVGTN
jgi:glycosyltransferase involved in cell wall biosynthesis